MNEIEIYTALAACEWQILRSNLCFTWLITLYKCSSCCSCSCSCSSSI